MMMILTMKIFMMNDEIGLESMARLDKADARNMVLFLLALAILTRRSLPYFYEL